MFHTKLIINPLHSNEFTLHLKCIKMREKETETDRNGVFREDILIKSRHNLTTFRWKFSFHLTLGRQISEKEKIVVYFTSPTEQINCANKLQVTWRKIWLYVRGVWLSLEYSQKVIIFVTYFSRGYIIS